MMNLFARHFPMVALAVLSLQVTGCGPAASVHPSGTFSEEQKVAAQAEYQSVEDEESKGNNKKKKAGKR